MRNLFFTLAYDGTAYHGWQVQTNGISVQQTLQDAFEKVLGERGNVVGCSRTDAGVHANMYCFNMRTQSRLSCGRIMSAINATLPFDIAVTSCREVSYDFHARYDCISKQYVYRIWNSPVRNPFLNGRALHYKYPLDEKMLENEAKAFLGQHDYASFCSAHSKIKSTVRSVSRFTVERSGEEIIITVEANGFLYNMVRIMVGTLLKIAQGKIEKGAIPGIIAAKDRSRAGVTAPAHGLYLNQVNYPVD
jgi:tRNA pseudouridine38-40 synthase